jgi:hypothetical protein
LLPRPFLHRTVVPIANLLTLLCCLALLQALAVLGAFLFRHQLGTIDLFRSLGVPGAPCQSQADYRDGRCDVAFHSAAPYV